MRAAIYARVSTSRQTEENQLPECQRIAQVRGYEVVEVYREQESAAKRRPEFDRLMADARRGRFRVVVIWDFSRFGRSFTGNIQDVKELDRVGVALVSAKDDWLDTTSGLVRNILLGVFAAYHEHERSRLIERINAGLDRARREGKVLGRPRKFVAPVEVRRLRERGLSWRRIAKALKVSATTARRAVEVAS